MLTGNKKPYFRALEPISPSNKSAYSQEKRYAPKNTRPWFHVAMAKRQVPVSSSQHISTTEAVVLPKRTISKEKTSPVLSENKQLLLSRSPERVKLFDSSSSAKGVSSDSEESGYGGEHSDTESKSSSRSSPSSPLPPEQLFTWEQLAEKSFYEGVDTKLDCTTPSSAVTPPEKSPWKQLPAFAPRNEDEIWGQLSRGLFSVGSTPKTLQGQEEKPEKIVRSSSDFSDSGCEGDSVMSPDSERLAASPRKVQIRDIKSLWKLPYQEFKKEISQMPYWQLSKLGESELEDMPSLPMLQAFYGRVQKALPETFDSIDWLYGVLKPLAATSFYDDALSATICDRLQQFLNKNSPLTDKADMLGGIMKAIAKTGFIHPVLVELAGQYLQAHTPVSSNQIQGFLHIARQCMIIHALACEQKDKSLAQALEKVVRSFITIAIQYQKEHKYRLSRADKDMIHWLNLYGYFVLKMSIDCPNPQNAASLPPTISEFQQTVAAKLKEHLPCVDIQQEVTLKDTGLSADIFCEPRIVVEVDGRQFHCRRQLPRPDQAVSQMFFRETGKTVLKRSILQHAGYTVINVSEKSIDSLQSMASRITSLRSGANLSARPTLLRRAVPPKVPAKWSPRITANEFIPGRPYVQAPTSGRS